MMLFCPLTKNSYGAIYAWIALTRQFGGNLGCDRLKNGVTVEVDSARRDFNSRSKFGGNLSAVGYRDPTAHLEAPSEPTGLSFP